MKWIPYILCLLFAAGLLHATTFAQQKAAIKEIQVLHAQTGLPISHVLFSHPNQGYLGSTDEQGMLTLPVTAQQLANIRVSCVGFQPTTLTASMINSQLGPHRISLVPTISKMQEVEVHAAARNGLFQSIADLDIHVRPVINSQEVLRVVPGLFIGQHAGGGKAEQIFLRGFDIDHGTDIQLTVDGMPVNMVSHAHGQGYADLHFVIPELIERVEFNKGPYFADKGNFATAGYVDFRTKQTIDHSFVRLEGGQFNTWRAVGAVNLLPQKKRAQHSLYAAGEASFTRGFFDSPQDFSRFNGMIKYHGQISQKSRLTLTGTAFTSEWLASGQIPDRAVNNGTIGWFGAIDDTEGGSTSRYNLNAELHTRLSNKLSWKNQLTYSRYLFELYSNFTFFLNDPVDGDQIRQRESRNLMQYLSTLKHEHQLGGKQARLEAGLQSRFDATANSELSRTKNRTELREAIMQGDIREANVGLFVQEEIKLNDKLDASVGLRADYFTNRYLNQLEGSTRRSQSAILSPKFRINYRASNKLQLYAYGGQGFHSNDTRVAVLRNGRDVVTPAWGSDLGAVIKIGDKAILQTALWYLWLQQEFVYVGDEGVVEPGGRTRRMGWDASLRYELIPNLYADVDVNVVAPRALGVPKEESYIPLAPTFTTTGGFTYRKANGWNGSLRYRYMADRAANETKSVIAEGYFVADAAINYTAKKWEVGVSIQNIFNTRWKETQFDTESRLANEPEPVSEIHFTPGTPFFARLSLSWFFR